MEWIVRTATLAAGFLVLAGCRSEEPEPLNLGPIVVPVEETVAEEDALPPADRPSEPQADETLPEPAEEPSEPVDPIGATIDDGPIGAVAKALWRSVVGEPESPPEDEPPAEDTQPSEP